MQAAVRHESLGGAKYTAAQENTASTYSWQGSSQRHATCASSATDQQHCILLTYSTASIAGCENEYGLAWAILPCNVSVCGDQPHLGKANRESPLPPEQWRVVVALCWLAAQPNYWRKQAVLNVHAQETTASMCSARQLKESHYSCQQYN